MDKTIIINYDGCIAANGQLYNMKVSPVFAMRLAEIINTNKADIIFCSEKGIEVLEKSAKELESYNIRVTGLIAEGGSIIKDRKNDMIEILPPSAQIDFIQRLAKFFKELADENNYVLQENKKAVISLFRDQAIFTREQFFLKFKDFVADLMLCGLIKESDMEKVRILQANEGIDIYTAAAGKEKAVKKFLLRAGLDDIFIGIGSSLNDMKWLNLLKQEFGGVIIAPENAVEEVKAVSDYVGKGDSLEGVINGLSKWLNNSIGLFSSEEREVSGLQL